MPLSLLGLGTDPSAPRLGRVRIPARTASARRPGGQQQDSQIGTLVGALLALLGFLMAFTFGMAGSRFDARKQLLLDEANSIGTAHLRAGLLPEPHRGKSAGYSANIWTSVWPFAHSTTSRPP